MSLTNITVTKAVPIVFLSADGTETLAFPQADGTYKLHGYKWFSSATDSDMTLTLARIVDPDGSYGQVNIKNIKRKNKHCLVIANVCEPFAQSFVICDHNSYKFIQFFKMCKMVDPPRLSTHSFSSFLAILVYRSISNVTVLFFH